MEASRKREKKPKMRGMAASQLLVCHRKNPSLRRPNARMQDGQLLVTSTIKKHSSSESECGYDGKVDFIIISSDESERNDGMELVWEVGSYQWMSLMKTRLRK